MEVVVPDPSKLYSSSGMVESKSVGTLSPLQKQDSHRGLFVDRGVGSPRLVKSSSATTFSFDLNLDKESKVGREVHFFRYADQNVLLAQYCIELFFFLKFLFWLLEFNAGSCWSCCSSSRS